MNVNHTVIIDPELNSTMMVALGSAFNPSLPLHAPPPIRPAHGWMWQWFCPQILRVITYNCWFQNLFRPWTVGLDLGSAFNPSLPLHPPPFLDARTHGWMWQWFCPQIQRPDSWSSQWSPEQAKTMGRFLAWIQMPEQWVVSQSINSIPYTQAAAQIIIKGFGPCIGEPS